MTKAELGALGKRLLPGLPRFDSLRNVLFIRPIAHTIRGILLERSSDPRGFYVNVFLQPLFVPAEHFVLNVGWRLGGGSHLWNANAPNLIADLQDALNRQAFPFLEPVESPRDVALAARLQSGGDSSDPITQRVIGYAFARGGDVPQSVRVLDQLLEYLRTCYRTPGMINLEKEVSKFKVTLQTRPQDAQRQLDAWEAATTKALGLAKFR